MSKDFKDFDTSECLFQSKNVSEVENCARCSKRLASKFDIFLSIFHFNKKDQ